MNNYEGVTKNRDIYNNRFKDNSEFPYEPVLDLVIDIIKNEKYSAIADYGCGNGRFGFYYRNAVKEGKLTGIDISEEALKISENIYDQVCLTDGLSIPDIEFDFILLNSVIEHIPFAYWDQILDGIHSKLKPGGGIFLIMPNKYSPTRLLTNKWVNEKDELGHVSLTGLGYVKKKLKEHGFRDIQSSFKINSNKLPDYISAPKIFPNLFKYLYSLLYVFPFFYAKDSFSVFAKK